MNEADAIKRLSPEHRQRAESIAVVVEQALASAQNTIAALEKRIAELEAFVKCPIGLDEASDICSAGTCYICLSKLRQTFDAERQRRESAEAAIQAITQSDAEPVGWRYRVKQGGWSGWHGAIPTREEAQACVDMDKQLYSIEEYEIRPVFDHPDASAGLIEAATILLTWVNYTAGGWPFLRENDGARAALANLQEAVTRSRAADRSGK